MPAIFNHIHTVSKSEIDELGHANNTVYINWMQDAAVAHSKAQGWASDRYHEAGFAWVARSHKIEYLRPAHEGDVVTVRTWIADMQRVTSLRCYEMVRGTDKAVVARAETRWVFIHLETRKPVRIPAAVQADFEIVLP